VYGNSNNLSSNLNSRVIQIVIDKNLTLADAFKILGLLWTNKTGNVTVFAFFATSQFYTLGFSWEVSKLVANTSVVNGGNYSAPPPPPAWWQLFFNTIAGWANRAWNALLAVGAFFLNVGKWLVQAFMSVVKGLTTGDWTDFKNLVLKPLADAILKFIKWITDLIVAAVKWLFSPLIDAYNEMVKKIASVAAYAVDPPPMNAVLLAFWGAILFSAFGIFLLAAFIALTVVMKVTNFLPGGQVAAIVIGVLAGLFIGIQIATMLFSSSLSDVIPQGIDTFIGVSFSCASLVIAASLYIAAISRAWKTVDDAAANLFFSLLSMIVLFVGVGVAGNHKDLGRMGMAFILDLLALAIAFGGDGVYVLKPGVGVGSHYSLLTPVANALRLADRWMTTISAITDGVQIVKLATGR